MQVRSPVSFPTAAFVTLLSALAIAFNAVPLGVPGEWTWTRHSLPMSAGECLDRILPAAFVGSAGCFVLSWLTRKRTRSRFAKFCCLPALATFGLLWTLAVQQAAPSPHKELKPLWVNYDRSASGYFFTAVFQIEYTPDFLASYEARMREGDVLHFGTHPPGLIVMSRMARNLMRQRPELIPFVMATADQDAVTAFREIELRVAAARPLSDSELAALQLLNLCSQLCIALTPVAVYLIVRRLADTDQAWIAGCLMTTVPGMAVFCPKSDVLYPFTASVLIWLSCSAILQTNMIRQIVSASFAGAWLWLCLILSLAHIPVVAMLALFTAFLMFRSNLETLKRISLSLAIALMVFTSCVLIWNRQTACNLWAVWPLNLNNHAGFYGQSTRTWLYWLPANLGELALTAGTPMLLLAANAMTSIPGSIRKSLFPRSTETPASPLSPINAFLAATLLTWCLLWLSGKNMGEAMRLWCFLTPWVVVAASSAIAAGHEGRTSNVTGKLLCGFLLLQMLTAVVTAGRINGYSF
ncbi:MAG: hypothetical protein JNL58_28685 [Planctomyces sp.]|nr:hypothetical protein [Planctomyces sp.]